MKCPGCGGKWADIRAVPELEGALTSRAGRTPARSLNGGIQRGLVVVVDLSLGQCVSERPARCGELASLHELRLDAFALQVVLEGPWGHDRTPPFLGKPLGFLHELERT